MSVSINDGRVGKIITEITCDFTGNPESDIAVIYDELHTADPEIRDALMSGGDRKFREEFLHQLFTNEKCAFHDYCTDPKTGQYAEGYLGCILSIYDGYRQNPPEDVNKDLNWLAGQAAELVMHGINGQA